MTKWKKILTCFIRQKDFFRLMFLLCVCVGGRPKYKETMVIYIETNILIFKTTLKERQKKNWWEAE